MGFGMYLIITMTIVHFKEVKVTYANDQKSHYFPCLDLDN